MKEAKLSGKLRAMIVVLIVFSLITYRYVHDHDLRWVFLATEGLLLGIWIGVAGSDWIQRGK